MRAGVAGLLRDKTRPSRIPRLPASVRTVALTLGELPGETTHWYGRDDGESGWHQRLFGAADLADARTAAAPSAPL